MSGQILKQVKEIQTVVIWGRPLRRRASNGLAKYSPREFLSSGKV